MTLTSYLRSDIIICYLIPYALFTGTPPVIGNTPAQDLPVVTPEVEPALGSKPPNTVNGAGEVCYCYLYNLPTPPMIPYIRAISFKK